MLKRIAETTIKGYWVSTVLLPGYDGRPDFYETMVFDRRINPNNWTELNCWRDKTESKALASHCKALLWVKRELNTKRLANV